jgi:hypothetical protein
LSSSRVALQRTISNIGNMADDTARPGCSPSVDGSFGPIVDDCVRTFDFTLLFEESILSILPSSIFLILAFLRIGVLSGRKRRVGGHVFSTVKVVSRPNYLKLFNEENESPRLTFGFYFNFYRLFLEFSSFFPLHCWHYGHQAGARRTALERLCQQLS